MTVTGVVILVFDPILFVIHEMAPTRWLIYKPRTSPSQRATLAHVVM